MQKYYMEYGNKESPLLVFIHGGGVGGWMWYKQIEYFSAYHCYEHFFVPDIGHGFPVAKPDLFNQVLEDWIMHQQVHKL